jgi:hypothetical protein
VEEMGRIKSKIVSNLMDIANRIADGEESKTRATTNERGHQKMIEEIDTAAKGGDPATTTTTAPTVK